ncbi:unnamed protein product [Orchesella dallaii]|uniref:C2H2-type domain-containing protein n=1 Tax=Orchesella dallaii TaxID=48710 RepID=A0ABP1S1W7_9HEXA
MDETRNKNLDRPSLDNEEVSNTAIRVNNTYLEPSYICDHCKRGFYTSSLFIHHVAIAHTTPRALANRMSSNAFDAARVGAGKTTAFASNSDTRSPSYATENKK